MTLRSYLKVPGRLTLGNFSVQRRPLRVGANSLVAKPVLNRSRTPVSRTRIDGHVAGGIFLISDFFSSGRHYHLFVVGVEERDSMSAGYTHLIFRLVVVRLKLG